jgi:hypothetical protein
MAKARLALRLFLLFSIAGVFTHASPVFSTPDEVNWSRMSLLIFPFKRFTSF